MAIPANHRVAVHSQPMMTRYTAADTAWYELVLAPAIAQGCNRVAIRVDGGGKLSHTVITGDAVASTDDYGTLPDGQWLAIDFEPDSRRPLRVFIAADTASSAVEVHTTRREVCRCRSR